MCLVITAFPCIYYTLGFHQAETLIWILELQVLPTLSAALAPLGGPLGKPPPRPAPLLAISPQVTSCAHMIQGFRQLALR